MPSSTDFEKLIAAHDGTMALVYIYLSVHSNAEKRDIARDLCLTVKQVEDSLEKLSLQSLLPVSSQQEEKVPFTPEPADTRSNYTAADFEEASKDNAFSALRQESEQITGRILNSDDLNYLLDIYWHLQLPAATIYTLLHYCDKIAKAKPRMSFISKQAYNWKNSGIISVEDAELFVDEDLKRRTMLGEIKSVLQISDRKLTSAEEEYITSWLKSGRTIEEIEEAYEKTVNNTGKRSFPYMNKVLLNPNSSKPTANGKKILRPEDLPPVPHAAKESKEVR